MFYIVKDATFIDSFPIHSNLLPPDYRLSRTMWKINFPNELLQQRQQKIETLARISCNFIQIIYDTTLL